MEKILEFVFRKLRERHLFNLIKNDSIVCDLGCGSGKFLMSVENKIAKGIGVDRKVKTQTNGKVIFIKGDLNKVLDLPSNSFDVVTILAVLEHLDNPNLLVKEAYRILKKDGKLIMTTPSKRSKPILEFLAFKLGVIERGHIEEHKNYFTKQKLTELLSGFRGVKVKPFEFGMNNLSIGVKK